MSNTYSFTVNIDGIPTIIKSLSEANKYIKDFTAKIIVAKEAGRDFGQEMRTLQQIMRVKDNITALNRSVSSMSDNFQQSQTASANAAQALLNFNYVVRDSAYFTRNFSLGILAIGNNLNPLIDSFNRLRKEALEKNISTFTLLREAMVGGAGISIAFSILVTAIQSYIFWADQQNKAGKDNEKTFEDIKKKVDELRGSYEDLAQVQSQYNEGQMSDVTTLQTKIKEMDNWIARLEAHAPDAKKQIDDAKARRVALQLQLDLMSKQTLADETLLYEKYLNGLIAASKKGGQAMLDFAKSNGLTQQNLDTLIKVLKDTDEQVFTLGGNISALADPKLTNLARQLHLNAEDVRRATKAWEEFTHPKHVKKVDELAEFMRKLKNRVREFDIALQEATWGTKWDKLFGDYKGGKPQLEIPVKILPLEYDEKNSYYMKSKELMERSTQGWKDATKKLWTGEVKQPKDPVIEGIEKDIKDVEKTATDVANVVGEAFTSAFTKGRFALNEFINSLLIAIGKMLLLKFLTEAIMAILTGDASVVSSTANTATKTATQTATTAASSVAPKISVADLGNSNLAPQVNKVQLELRGELKARGNDLIGQIYQMQNQYNRQVKLGTIA